MSLSKEQKPDPWSIQRGNYNWTPGAPLLLATFRCLSLPAQYMIITKSTALPFIDPNVSLSSLTLHQSLMLAMPAYIVFKHVYWLFFLMREPLTINFSFFGGIADMAFEAVTSYMYTLAPQIPLWSPDLVVPGALMNFTGITAEWLSEIQRSRWKRDPKNDGKVYTGSLWGLVRNPSYACNVVFAFGYALAAGGPLYAVFYSGIYVSNFVFNAVPGFEAYMKQKYAGQWEAVERKVRWRLFPGIY
ncbi:hypothetical protein H072_5105 [Dactylellina haptotyla CBS 200.50]|uniref:Steroid 5-alpha reductase C-terminal domain-containing protein n=1 Tax=Dactylellina haptotyla (strain CBS 200.50) TaxID=1284197 RepID=S8C077_DACHA|nr:hypothetical protein H072_5105 [Dactylellina haptotyla CBS 200.50]